MVADRFESGSDDVVLGGTSGYAIDAASRVLVPVGRTETDKGRDKIDASVVLHRFCHLLGIRSLGQHFESVAQPLYRRACDEYRAFERVDRFAGRSARQRGNESVFRDEPFLAGVEENEASGAVCILHGPRLETHLSEHRGLLVACDPRDGNAGR